MNKIKFIQDTINWANQYPWLEMLSSLAILIVVAFVANFIAKRVVVSGVRTLLSKFKFIDQQIFSEHSVIRRIANVIPALIILYGIRTVPHLSAPLHSFIQMVAQAFIFLTIALSISEFLNIFNSMYQRNPRAKNKPIKGYLQLVKMIVYIVCILMIMGTFLNKDVFSILAGFGAMAAVLMLVFQNTILSIVASVQISSYDMIRIGDWIEMPSLNADGTVIDMSLHTVTVENFDKTLTTVPTNKLVTDTFKNWRGMAQSGVRRIKRSIYIDQSSICFLDQHKQEELKSFLLLNQYLDNKQAELERFNEQFEDESAYNLRQMTNVGTFRAYIHFYLQNHPGIAKNQTLMVRQLQPTSDGLPLEIYAFTNTIVWTEYEAIQSDIFDHLMAIIPAFGLKIFQAPSGLDLRSLSSKDSAE